MRLYCTRCEEEFEAEEPRCPKCLRKSTVQDPAERHKKVAKRRSSPLLAGDPAGGRKGFGAFALRFTAGTVLMALLAGTGSMALPGRELWMIVYAALLGGVLLALGWTGLAAIVRNREPEG